MDKTANPRKGPLTAVWSATLYYAQGLPFSIVRQMAVIYFKEQGVSLKNLGLIGLYGIPWTFKFLWSPLVDTFSTKRRWVITMEFILTMVIGFLAFQISLGVTPTTVASIFLVLAFVSATHDIATDGFYLEVLNKDNQAKYSGWVVAAYRLAMLSGGGLLISLSGKLGWPGAFGVAAAIFGMLVMWHTFALPRFSQNRLAGSGVAGDKTEGRARGPAEMVEGFKAFIKLPGIGLAIAFIILFKLGDALLFGMSAPFLLDAGMTKAQYGIFSGVFGISAAIAASIGGGWFISKYKLRRGILYFGIFQNFAIPLYALVAWFKPGLWALVLAVVVEQVAAGLGTAAYTNFLMRQNNPKYKATHYAIASGMMSLTTMMGSVISGFGAQKYGYPLFFTLAFFASLPGLCLLPFVSRRPECQ